MEGLVQMLNKKSSTNFENLQELKKAMGIKPIVVIGMMASGKTTVAKELAKLSELKHIDLDEEIVKSQGASISEIFEQKGEEYFRELESKILKQIFEQNPSSIVLSVGGGTPSFFDNMEFINDHGFSFYLNVTQENIIDRLLNNQSQDVRPMIDITSPTKLINKIYKLYDERFDSYLKAQFFINGNEEPAIVAEKIWIMAERL